MDIEQPNYASPRIVDTKAKNEQLPSLGGSILVAEEDVGQKQNNLKRNLKGRHIQMISIGGAIGAGLFVGVGQALSDGGPASLVSYDAS
ncbi:hypothetical protein F5884DRAFT_121318 [Xylogone sp. PMI_703]|nr:hypothetical protein F5884DRAFT_121318 [Xylogone sp. PMI_703]